MDLRLRFVASHPRAGNNQPGDGSGATTEFALSSRRPSLLLARGSLLVEQTTSSLGVRASIRTSAPVEKLVYCGGARVFLAFLEDLTVAAYRECDGSAGGVELVGTHSAVGETRRSCAMADASRNRSFAVFNKTDSPNIHCVFVSGGGRELEVVKLHAGIAGAQESVSAVDKGMSKLRSRVATKAKSKTSAVVAVAAHPNKHLAAAAYENGMLRVWDVSRKELRSVFDSQLMLRERIIDIALHPVDDVLVCCTSLGRVMSFAIRSIAAGKSEEPQLATSKLRDRNRRFRAMCFLEGSPTVLLLLTSSRRVLVRLLNDRGQVVSSSRFPKASRQLSLEAEDGSGVANGSGLASTLLDGRDTVTFACEPSFGLVGLSFGGKVEDVFVYETHVDGVSGVRRPIVGASVDTGFSQVSGKAFNGPVQVYREGLFAYGNHLYMFDIESKILVDLCRLPASSSVRYLEVARDQYGSPLAVLVFVYLDGETDINEIYDGDNCTTQYMIVTKRAEGEEWNVSEPMDGSTGCFLNASGQHDRVLILSLDGKFASVRSFAGQRLSSKQQKDPQQGRAARGVQKFRVSESGVTRVFRSPFSSWCAVVYEDSPRKRLVVSKNAFRVTPAFGESSGSGNDDTFTVDEESGMDLERGERVLDIRWQWLPGSRRSQEKYLGAILTNKRVRIVRDVFDPLAKFDFEDVHRSVVPFAVPTLSWMGPAILLMFGEFLYSLTLDGKVDMLAGMSKGDNACVLVAGLPDRVVYLRPARDKSLPVSVVSRPIGMMSVLVRGMLALPSARQNDGSYYIDKLKGILTNHDASQGSEALVDELIRNDLSPIAYILATSDVGQHNLPALKRAAFLGQIGDLRGSLAVAEAEYSRLPAANMFHDGTELYRLLQRILNMAMASGDFAVGQRCSELLGRKGTFSAFIDSEGGYAAVTALSKYAKKCGNIAISEALATLVERSSKSCIATDISGMPSIAQLRNARTGIAAYDKNAVRLGTADTADIFVLQTPGEDKDGSFVRPETKKVDTLGAERFLDRLEMLHRDEVQVLKRVMDVDDDLDGAMMGTGKDVDRLQMGGDRGVPRRFLTGTVPEAEVSGMLGLGSSAPLEEPLPALPAPEVRQDADSRGEELKLEALDAAVGAQRSAAVHKRQLDADGAQSRARIAMNAADSAVVLRGEAGSLPSQVAEQGLLSAFEKMGRSRYPAALREVERTLKEMYRAKDLDGMRAHAAQVSELVTYSVAFKLLVAMENVASSQQVQSMPEKYMFTAQYASALAGLPLRMEHRFSAVLRAVNANLRIDNYGFAAQGLRSLREMADHVSIAPPLKGELRTKFALCESRGGTNRVPVLQNRFCCHSLRVIAPGSSEWKCNFCPAFFLPPALVEDGIHVGMSCPCCFVGKVCQR